jgi:hypothetical protein
LVKNEIAYYFCFKNSIIPLFKIFLLTENCYINIFCKELFLLGKEKYLTVLTQEQINKLKTNKTMTKYKMSWVYIEKAVDPFNNDAYIWNNKL